MATATSRLRLEKQAYNSNDNAWGGHLNDGVFDLIDEAFGIQGITVDGDVTLTSQNYLTDESRCLFLILSGAGGFTVTTPAVDKPYFVVNDCAAAVTVQPGGGTGSSIGAGRKLWYYTNPAGDVGYFDNPKINEIAAPDGDVDFNSQKGINVADGATGTNDIANVAQVEGLVNGMTSTVDAAVADATAQAVIATDKATDASASASDAAASATAASASASDAAASATAAATFDPSTYLSRGKTYFLSGR